MYNQKIDNSKEKNNSYKRNKIFHLNLRFRIWKFIKYTWI